MENDERRAQMDKLSEVQQAFDLTLASTKVLARLVGRGEGGREVALARTKLQEVGYWLREANRLIAQDE